MSDNARGIAEMSGEVDGEAAQVLTDLDAVGTTTKAVTEGIALILVEPDDVVGAVIGAAVVFLFSGLAIRAVSQAAGRVVFEVRKQFREHRGVRDRTERPDHGAVVDICTRDALRELATPGCWPCWPRSPSGSGWGSGRWRPTWSARSRPGPWWRWSSPLRWGMEQRREDGRGRRRRWEGQRGARGHRHRRHVGDPFKDTAGPAINPLIKW